MEDDIMADLGNGTQVQVEVLRRLQSNLKQAQNILDQNRLLIREIDKNQESKIPDNLTRNVGLIKELNNNMRRMVDIYTGLSSSCVISMDNPSEEESANGHDGRVGQKRIRPNS